MEKAMAPHSSTLAWKNPWTEEPGMLQSMGSLRVRRNWATSISLFTFMHWRRKCNPLQCSWLENPRDRGAWWAAVYGVAQSWTRLKRLSSSSSREIITWVKSKLVRKQVDPISEEFRNSICIYDRSCLNYNCESKGFFNLDFNWETPFCFFFELIEDLLHRPLLWLRMLWATQGTTCISCLNWLIY